MASESLTEVVNCPFCPKGEPVHVKIPGGDVFCCQACGMTGPPAMEGDGPNAYERALRLWNTRGGIGHVHIARVPPGVPPDTAIVAENLLKASEKVLGMEYGPVDVSLLLLFSSQQKRLGVVSHRLDNSGIAALCGEVLNSARSQMQTDQTANRIIVPGR